MVVRVSTRRAALLALGAAASVLPACAVGTGDSRAAPGPATSPDADLTTRPVPPPSVAPAVIAQRRQPNVLLVTIDTLRTDHVGFLGESAGSGPITTPTLDRLAAEGAYGAAYVQLPQTLPNHASILTGTYIQTHGLRTTLWDPSRDAIPTLDQILRGAGYRTAGIVSWYSLDHEFTNLVRAYDHWEQVVTRYGTRERVTPEETRAAFRAGTDMSKAFDGDARLTSDAAIAWLDAHGTLTDKPWFFWLHYRDPHYPFTPPAGLAPQTGSSFDGGPTNLGRISAGYAPTPAEMAGLRAAYDGEITYTDAQLARVFNRLEELKLAEDTIVVVTGDHGESFLEHGPWDWLHGHSVYEAAVRVPLLVRFPAAPAAVAPATRLYDRVQSADITPTVLSLAGLPVSPTFEGYSFAPLLAGTPSPATRGAWGTIHDDSQNYVVDGDWKLVRWNNPGFRTGDELYHLASDPRETRDYRSEHRDVAARLSGLLDRWLTAKGSDQPWRPWETA
ncbi:MAG TPA: sulfatase [Chloroflexota bacterium]|nr:sulfatase [Chloroflexota bacterium]